MESHGEYCGMKPIWLVMAEAFIGTREIPGARHNSVIVQWWADIRSAIRDDETPYCAAFVGAMLERSGYASTRSAAARSYLNWGEPLAMPIVGCIVVYSRPGCSWCGHVGFVVGRDSAGNIMTLGANQADTVSVVPFAVERVLGYRWPKDGPQLVTMNRLPTLTSDGRTSSREA